MASAEVDLVRRLLCHEPRGHADMYGCFLVPPDDDGADLGVLFWHKDGYSTACGHGTIALGAWAVESDRVIAAPDGVTDVTIDVPSGRVLARVRMRDGLVESVAFRNVPAYVLARAVEWTPRAARSRSTCPTAARSTRRSTPPQAELSVKPERLEELIALGREVKRALDAGGHARHPSDERLSGVYGTIFFEDLGDGETVRASATSPSSRTARSTARRAARGPRLGWPCSPRTAGSRPAACCATSRSWAPSSAAAWWRRSRPRAARPR